MFTFDDYYAASIPTSLQRRWPCVMDWEASSRRAFAAPLSLPDAEIDDDEIQLRDFPPEIMKAAALYCDRELPVKRSAQLVAAASRHEWHRWRGMRSAGWLGLTPDIPRCRPLASCDASHGVLVPV
eukprot:GHVT01044620.1.p1 GENE.GHVT01044620.1~~GHVT01044620.1.p1  ORF type:complete len:126 (-),score=16.73 GHVT01044620.1:46-423(-)